MSAKMERPNQKTEKCGKEEENNNKMLLDESNFQV
jgi:hypothetical protein